MSRLEAMDPSSPEYSISRTYLEIISDLPWKEPKPENFSIDSARKILERDHYGMKTSRTEFWNSWRFARRSRIPRVPSSVWWVLRESEKPA
jgi:hypothetical protein